MSRNQWSQYAQSDMKPLGMKDSIPNAPPSDVAPKVAPHPMGASTGGAREMGASSGGVAHPVAKGAVESTQSVDLDDLRASARGDRSAFGRLYDRHAPLLMALGVRILGERREAEDILHDCFVETWRHIGDYDPERASVKSWLVLRMRSRCLDRLRSAGVSRRESLGERPDETLERASLRAPTEAAEAADQRVDASRLGGVLAALPEEQRAVLVLGFFDGLSSSEIAAELGIPIGTVKSRVRSAMSKLRAALGVADP